MRRITLLLVLLVTGTLASPPPASATEWRPVISAVGSWRFFSDAIDLRNEWAYGARFGLESSSRFSLFIDYVECKTWRHVSFRSAEVMGLRALARVDLLRGKVRPYAIGGLGGLLFQFRDTPNAGVGTMTFAVGAEGRFAERWRVFGEAGLDHFYYESVVYSPTGTPYSTGQRGADVIETASIGIGWAF
ncbi:MAG TPA: hypothetical protein VK123_07715 [Candidatus Limnocylindrales bacterium]|nr:hypothetical protein [Candidatus Limnocylindrales bacterium]